MVANIRPTAVPAVALALGVWLPEVTVTAVAACVTLLTLLVVMFRLRRRAQAEYAARVTAERLAALADTLQQLLATISRARTPPAVIEACVPEFLQAVQAAAGAFVLVGEGGRSGTVLRVVGCDNPPSIPQFPLSTYPALEHVVSGNVIAAFDAPASPPGGAPRVPALDLLASYRTAVAVPLVTAGRTAGILVLGFHEARNLALDERDFLLSAGRRTAEALVRARAYETSERERAEAEAFRARADAELGERQKAEAALRESETKYRALAARTTRLYELSAALSQAISVRAVAAAIVRHGKVVLGASAGSVALLSLDRSRFDVLYSDEDGDQAADGGSFAVDAGLCATEVIETRQPVFVSSFADCQQRYWRSASIAATGGFASAAVLPLVVEDAAIGILAFHFTAPVHFDEGYTAVLTAVEQHCAQAIDRARLYDAAQRARADAEAANRSKDDFLSIVSHELRTPLTAVLGWSSMLRSGSVDPARTARAVEAIYNNATRQAHLIEELLDISRIVGGRVVFEQEALDLGDTIRGAIEAIMPQADAKGVTLRLAASPSVPVMGDPRRLEQVFLNLLANAVKFTQAGGCVTVDVAPGAQTVEVRVADNGAGINPAFLGYVFEQFRQGDNSTARTKGGLGLGLFIARQLVEAHGGSVRAESAGPGTGATFIVSLPVLSSASTAPTRTVTPPDAVYPSAGNHVGAAAPSLAGVRVLIVDDDPDVRELMAAALEHSGASVTSVGSADDALDVLSRSEMDVLLADIAMPGQDGYDLIKATRALPWLRAAHIPAAAVTACARDDERQRALAAGFQRHLTKPVPPEVLVQTVASLASAAAHAFPRGIH